MPPDSFDSDAYDAYYGVEADIVLSVLHASNR